MNRSFAHAAHLAYLEGAEQTHRFVAQLAAVAVYLSRCDSDVGLVRELEVLQTLIAAINEAEDGARTVHLELDAAPAEDTPAGAKDRDTPAADAPPVPPPAEDRLARGPAEARVARGSTLRVVIDWLYGGQVSRDVRQLHLIGRYNRAASSYRLTCREAAVSVDVQTWRDTV